MGVGDFFFFIIVIFLFFLTNGRILQEKSWTTFGYLSADIFRSSDLYESPKFDFFYVLSRSDAVGNPCSELVGKSKTTGTMIIVISRLPGTTPHGFFDFFINRFGNSTGRSRGTVFSYLIRYGGFSHISKCL